MEESREKMLIGEVFHSIDTKGRYIVPSKFREDLGDKFIVAKGLDDCLCLYSLESWEETLSEFKKQLPANDEDARAVARVFLASVFDVEIDKQFRVVLPQILRNHANLEKEIVSVGMAGRVEIWDKATWDKFMEKSQVIYEANAARYMGPFI